jgi:catechol-2,3-dioxygenase
VSEALYLRDPDGNGLELYHDRPRDQWPRDEHGDLAMFTRTLDLRGLLASGRAGPGESSAGPRERPDRSTSALPEEAGS